MLKGKNVLLCVTGSIAAYKIAELASRLVKLHCNVDVIMTKNATNFINPITFETLTGNNSASMCILCLRVLELYMIRMWRVIKCLKVKMYCFVLQEA